MLPMVISNATRTFGGQDPQGKPYRRIHVCDMPTSYGENVMVTLWEPTPKELKELNEGGAIRLAIFGTVHPPVAIETQPAPPLEEQA